MKHAELFHHVWQTCMLNFFHMFKNMLKRATFFQQVSFFFLTALNNKDMRPTTMVRSFLQAIADHFQYFFYFYASNVYYGCLPLPLLYKPSG